MYQIIKNGDSAPFALVEKPIYVRQHAEGFYALCAEAEAQGIALNGQPYNLLGRLPMEGLETVLLVETDGGSILHKSTEHTAELEATVDELTIAMLEG